jgi:hypothetical protein
MLEWFRAWRVSYRKRANRRAWERARFDAEFRASNGEHLTRVEREQYQLPDWTG